MYYLYICTSRFEERHEIVVIQKYRRLFEVNGTLYRVACFQRLATTNYETAERNRITFSVHSKAKPRQDRKIVE